jgi:hypothetical protein
LLYIQIAADSLMGSAATKSGFYQPKNIGEGEIGVMVET